ncbi:MAG: septum formation initiator family protein [Ignavibacteriaceae bacterium]|nr:septum formation initiator family protein [Ignavibacteriaceae bacterium]
MAKNKKKYVLYLFLAIVILGLFYIFFNERGFVKYMGLKSQVDSMQVELEKVQLENERLKNEIDSLQKKIPAKMEQVAREKYNMKREGETLIEVEEK